MCTQPVSTVGINVSVLSLKTDITEMFYYINFMTFLFPLNQKKSLSPFSLVTIPRTIMPCEYYIRQALEVAMYQYNPSCRERQQLSLNFALSLHTKLSVMHILTKSPQIRFLNSGLHSNNWNTSSQLFQSQRLGKISHQLPLVSCFARNNLRRLLQIHTHKLTKRFSHLKHFQIFSSRQESFALHSCGMI